MTTVFRSLWKSTRPPRSAPSPNRWRNPSCRPAPSRRPPWTPRSRSCAGPRQRQRRGGRGEGSRARGQNPRGEPGARAGLYPGMHPGRGPHDCGEETRMVQGNPGRLFRIDRAESRGRLDPSRGQRGARSVRRPGRSGAGCPAGRHEGREVHPRWDRMVGRATEAALRKPGVEPERFDRAAAELGGAR